MANKKPVKKKRVIPAGERILNSFSSGMKKVNKAVFGDMIRAQELLAAEKAAKKAKTKARSTSLARRRKEQATGKKQGQSMSQAMKTRKTSARKKTPSKKTVKKLKPTIWA